MSYKKNILLSSGLLMLLMNVATASTPSMPGPYVGTYDVTETTAKISFQDNSADEDGFKVYIYKNNTLDTTLSPNPIIVPAHNNADPYQYANLSNLDPNTLYQVGVSAFNSDGESPQTIPSSENNGRFRTSPIVCKPAMPGEYVGVYNVTENSARISFLDNSDNEDGFKVYVYEYNTNNLVKTITVPALSGTGAFQYADITGLTPNTLYKVKVTAYSSGCGESDPTHPSSTTNGRFRTTSDHCPTMPGEYVGTYNVTDTSARISFIDNSDNEDGFKVNVYNYNTGVLVDSITLPSVNGVGGYQYTNINGLTPNTLYKVGVSAFNSSCTSPETQASSINNGRFKTQP